MKQVLTSETNKTSEVSYTDEASEPCLALNSEVVKSLNAERHAKYYQQNECKDICCIAMLLMKQQKQKTMKRQKEHETT